MRKNFTIYINNPIGFTVLIETTQLKGELGIRPYRPVD
jgi:hypothetical protein